MGKTVSEDLIGKIEEQANGKDINVSFLVREYRDKFADQPILRLIQDINQRVGIYSNILEDIKKIGPTDTEFDMRATEIKNKYENLLNLVPAGNLPNPTASSIVSYILDKLSAFGRALLEIMAKYLSEIRREIRLDPSISVHFDVEVGWSPKVTIGIEGSGAVPLSGDRN
jgi:hypothetical protein